MKYSGRGYLFALLAVASAQCPPEGLTTVTDFDVEEYTRATWYVQEQQVNGYQSEDDLFCVTATYDLETAPSVPFFQGTVVAVYNQADTGEVNGGVQQDPDSNILCARVESNNQPSKLSVAPCFLPNALAGPYWVMALGRDGARYEWALISGGQPTVTLDDGCTTRESGINNSGLWIFSRAQVLSPEKLAEAREAATALGYSLARMISVPQEGCNYENRFLKADEENPSLLEPVDGDESGSDESQTETTPSTERDNDEESEGSSLGAGILAGLVVAGVVLAVGAAVFIAGMVRIRNAGVLKSQEADAFESSGPKGSPLHKIDNKALIDVNV